MKALPFGKIAGILLSLCGLAVGQSAAPPAVLESAKTAVSDLGKQVVQGRYQVAIERMNPQWKERSSSRTGGPDKVEKQLADVARKMVEQGVTITSFQPQGEARSYEVGIGKKVETVSGKPVESLIYTKWLVLVPTLTKFSIFPKGSTAPIAIESTGYQVAISDKGKNDWTFIDGSSLTLNELRKLFVNLPQDMELPPIEKKQAR